ncbi:sigma-54-dependent Fis family transcriptional regulator [Reyranella sp. CPCC 100927]|uniref:sigma-54-dependent Fis family transcriptional regulator n=1 Tax=Reyranella sp. CPCC 100927 TaxID=2599616 RepID=UPI0011B6D2A1|nr:sigma-54-dependent Fis family transcriptional regulator [Reyranella sp. CPCC 100927]TWT01640.1 sigma-54-dependent Fis family transcriptional regulator [Reyranella sp. CPCC 100927]
MRDVPRQDLYTRAYFRDVGRAWERFLSDCPIEARDVRNVVLQSWARCVRQGVDPRRSAAPLIVDGDALVQFYDQNGALYTAISACIAPAIAQLAGTGMVLVTSDARGTLLTAHGDPSLADQMTANRIVPGACWGEDLGGTNAVGTALTLGRPVQIHAQEHFCEAGKPWSCNAGLIRDPVDRRILGVVDVTGPNHMMVMNAGPLVATLVNRIQAHIQAQETADRCQLIEAFYQQARPGRAIILCDARGRVVKAAPDIRRIVAMLGFDPSIASPSEIAGLQAQTIAWPRGLPDWLHPDWLTPVQSEGRCIGAVIAVPLPQPRPASTRTSTLGGAFRAMAEASPSLEPLLRQAEAFARQTVPVLLEGETGTGKDVLAQAIHAASPRAAGPFIALNCAALPKDILASELFGYADGAFTGARRGGAKGKFEHAHGGTLFLDEIGDMPLDLQPYLLRVLEEDVVWRLGESMPRRVDVRVIAASNRPLAQAIADGRVRADLCYRLDVASLVLPPLRERLDDIPHLVAALLRRIHRDGDRPIRVDDEVLEAFRSHRWPGNVRELRNALERMTLLANDGVMQLRHLPTTILDVAAAQGGASPAPVTLKSAEQQLVLAALGREGGNVSQAARTLGISRATLYRRLSAYGRRRRLE